MRRFLLTVIPASLLMAGMGTPPAEPPRAPLVALDWLRQVELQVTETDSGAVVTFTSGDSAAIAAVRDYVAELVAAASTTAVDPVCGMTVDRVAAEVEGLTVTHGGRTYFFCSASDRSDFLRQPAKFARP